MKTSKDKKKNALHANFLALSDLISQQQQKNKKKTGSENQNQKTATQSEQ